LYEWRWKEAGEAVARSLALAPNDAEIVNFAGDFYRFTLDRAKVIEVEQRAVELNPLQAVNHMDVAFAYLALGQPEKVIAPARTAISLGPGLFDAYDQLARAYGRLRRFDEMRTVIGQARQVTTPGSAELQSLEIQTAILEGRKEDALRLLEAFRPFVEQGSYSPAEYGYNYLLLGRPEQALTWFNLACQGHDAIMVSGETIDLEVIAANPVTRPVLEYPGLKELREIRRRNAAKQP
jgi:tetratricopeptide (TPR) repeat protein